MVYQRFIGIQFYTHQSSVCLAWVPDGLPSSSDFRRSPVRQIRSHLVLPLHRDWVTPDILLIYEWGEEGSGSVLANMSVTSEDCDVGRKLWMERKWLCLARGQSCNRNHT